ncbi:MAG: hypothetical protein IT379_08995 [Deltaproteobacteria bacterium]|nr:hypothetical protein [Deltaproteobacteria bacterium]
MYKPSGSFIDFSSSSNPFFLRLPGTIPSLPFVLSVAPLATRSSSLVVLAFALALAACGNRPSSSSTASRVGRRGPVELRGTVALDRALRGGPPLRTRGKLVLGRLGSREADDAADGYLTLRTILDMIPRLTVVGDVDVSRPAPFRLAIPAARDAHLLALLDVTGELVPSLFGAGGEGNLMGVAREAYVSSWVDPLPAVEIRLSHRRTLDRREHCTGTRTRLLRVDAPEVAGTLGNETSRRLCVHVPPSYETSPDRRYPVVYVLPTLFGDDTVLFRYGHVDRVADRLANELGRELIVVGVDSSTRAGNSYYATSAVTGDWTRFLQSRVVPLIDARYRTHARGSARALLGLSTGGFNAVAVALRDPESFGVVASWSPDALDLSTYLFGRGREHLRTATAHNRAFMRFEHAVGGPGQMVSYAADWSPDASAPSGFAWPIDLETGRANAHWDRWLAASPSSLLRDPARLPLIRRHLDDRIYVIAGRNDEFFYFDANQAFHEQLRAAGIRHTFVANDDGHADHGDERIDALLRFALSRLDAARSRSSSAAAPPPR